MKIRTLTIVASAAALLLLPGCNRIKSLVGGGEPKGQVVATVDGKEVTVLELRAELGNFSSRDQSVVKAAQQQALQRIIMRKLLADEARKQKLDKSSDFALQVQRGEETLLAQLYQRKLAEKIKQPTKSDADAYVASHPNQFGARKVLVLDQIIAAPNKIAPERLQPLKTLGEVKALLEADGVPYQENTATLDTLSANPGLITAIQKLPPGEIFVIPQGGALMFNQITSSRDAPMRGDPAAAYAVNAIRQQKAQEVVEKSVTDMRKAAESKIVYNPAYKPQAPKAATGKAVPEKK